MIFYHHYGFQSVITESFGDLGVTFFMMLSGFVLYISTESKGEDIYAKQMVKEFMYQRLCKIYPLYFICWIAAIVLMPYSGSRVGIFLGIFTLQSWIPIKEVYFAGNSVAWFISDLVFCYLIFVPLFRLLNQKSGCGIYVVSLYFVLYLGVIVFLPERLVHAIVYINPLMQCSNFIIGMIIGKIFLAEQKCKFKIRADISEFTALMIVAVSIAFYEYVATRLSFGAYWWPAAGLIIYVFSCCDGLPGIINKFMNSKPLILTGKLSFSFYLIHYTGIYLWQRGLEHIGFATSDNLLKIIQSIVLIVILFAVSFLINRYLEIPIYNKLKNMRIR